MDVGFSATHRGHASRHTHVSPETGSDAGTVLGAGSAGYDRLTGSESQSGAVRSGAGRPDGDDPDRHRGLSAELLDREAGAIPDLRVEPSRGAGAGARLSAGPRRARLRDDSESWVLRNRAGFARGPRPRPGGAGAGPGPSDR